MPQPTLNVHKSPGPDLWRERPAYLRQAEAISAGIGRSVTITGDVSSAVVVTGDGNRILAADADPKLLWEAYLTSLDDECSKLPLGVIDTEFVRGGGRRIRLGEVYVELDATSPGRPEEDAEERGWSWRLVRGEAQGRTAVRDLLAGGDSRRYVLLGDPGSGKTTLAHRLCHALAEGEKLPEGLAGLLPIRFVLREVAARHLGAGVRKGNAGILWNAFGDELARVVGDAAAPRLLEWVQQRVLTEGGFVVLDGLDEVPEARLNRAVLLESVRDLASQLRRSPSLLLVTARPYAYADPKWHLEGFEVLALAPFSAEQVGRFIDGWYLTAARQVFSWSAETAEAKARQLRRALERRPYLGDLASRPLLLTLMATLHSSWGQLPEDRADLYEETVKLLLGRWQRAREGGDGTVEESLSQLLRVEESRLREALEGLAFAVHERQGGEDERDGRPADISEGELLVAFKPLLGDVRPAELFGYLEQRAGLLVHRREGVYAFPHRSFQEYLAACHVGSLPEPGERFRELAYGDPAWWREVVLLGIGRARRGGLGNAVGLVTNLLPVPADESDGEEHWHVAVLCGEALQELRLRERGGDRPHYTAVLDRARDVLVRIVTEGRMSPGDRLEAGDVLGYLGDPRPGVAVVTVGEATLPDVDWIEVPEGTFTMGSDEGDSHSFDWEHPQHEVFVDRFQISRFPVTNAQYRLFYEGGGYGDRAFWSEVGWEWLQGAEVDVSGYPENWQDRMRKWHAGRPREKRQRPFYWDDEKLAAPSRPVVGVSWFEADAYCRWLTGRLREQGRDDALVSLPSEAQWEKAARGGSRRIWPWGDDFADGDCNSAEAGLERPSPVGMFPKNRSAFGVEDMAGNVWEWTATLWGRSFGAADFVYPYDRGDGREDRENPLWRILRGGSYYHEKPYVRCAYRGRLEPEYFNDDIGFRVVLSLANSEF